MFEGGDVDNEAAEVYLGVGIGLGDDGVGADEGAGIGDGGGVGGVAGGGVI